MKYYSRVSNFPQNSFTAESRRRKVILIDFLSAPLRGRRPLRLRGESGPIFRVVCPILFLVLSLIGCQKPPQVSYNIDRMPQEGILLSKWQILGPFPANGQQHFLEFDNLRQFGFNESTISFDQFVGIKPKDTSQTFTNQLCVSEDYKTDFNNLYHYADSMAIDANVYCACILHSGKERKLKLNFSSDDGSKVWLNHKLIYSCDRQNGIQYYDNYLDLDLKDGDNLLLVKVNNIKLGWQMFADVEEETPERLRRYGETFSLEFGTNYLQRSVITNDTLMLNHNLPAENYAFSVQTVNGSRVLSDSGADADSASWIIPKLKEGLYSTTFYDRGEAFSETFYKGDIVKEIHRLLQNLMSRRLEADTKRNIDALAYRYNHLLKPENLGKTDDDRRDWDRKMIFLFTSLDRYYNNLRRALDPEYDAVGGLLKTYVSKIDDGIQYYQLWVPRDYHKGKPLPLMIEFPKYMARHPSPLETYRFANIHLFDLFERLADKYNVIILDPGCRTIDKCNMNTIDEADLWEALAAVRKGYSIDTTRIYLRGACLSCRSAMKMAVKYPDKFAAMALVAPELTVSSVDNIYLQQNEPLNYLKNISNLPILDIHSKIDPHSPVDVSDKLSQDVKDLGFKNFTYRRLAMEFKTYYSEEYFDDIFDFLLKYSLDPSPSEIHFSTGEMRYNKSFWLTLDQITCGKNASIDAKVEGNTLTIKDENVQSFTVDLRKLPYSKNKPLTILDNGKKVFDAVTDQPSITVNPYDYSSRLTKNQKIEGPLADIFNYPFIVVPGTIGSEQETKQMQALADTLNNYWMQRYYNKCRIKSDRDITQRDLVDYSLLLLGTPKSNLVFKRLASRLPIRISAGSVEIGMKKVDGSQLCFYFVYPNPANPRNYVGIVGYNDPHSISLGYENDGDTKKFNDVSNYGWYDFKIWNAETSQNIALGYFDYFWGGR
jgi:dienelactone hydrolase